MKTFALSRKGKLALLLVAVLLASATLAGCAAGTRRIAQGWAGGIVSGDILFVGSMSGQLVALDPADGSPVGPPVTFTVQVPSGGFGCTPASASAVPIYGSPVISGDVVFVGGYDGKVYAIRFDENGLREQTMREYNPRLPDGSPAGAIIGGLAVHGNRIIFGTSSGYVFALDYDDGFKPAPGNWPFYTGEKIWSAPVVVGDTVFVTSFSRSLYALNVDDGTSRWAAPFHTDGTLTATPAVAGGRVYVGSFARRFYAVDAATGQEIWCFPADDTETQAPQSWFWATPLVHNGVVYAPNLDGKVYALDAATGSLRHVYDLGAPVSSAPVLVGDTLVVAAGATNRSRHEGKVFAIDTRTQTQRLLADIGERVHAPLFASDSTVYVHTMVNSLYAIDVATGVSQKFSLESE